MPLLLSIALLLLWSWSSAQPAGGVSVGVIASRTGEAAGAGASQALAAFGWARETREAGGVFGVRVDVEVLDDAGSPARAAEQARRLAEGGAWAVVCCTTPAATAAVSAVAEELGLLHLALSDPSPLTVSTRGSTYWTFTLWPTEVDALSAAVADALAAGRGSFALMTTDDGYGDAVADALRSLVGYAGMRLVREERFATGATELRPEALLVATSQPGAVAVWASGPDTATAVSALRARGYEGLVYVRPALAAPASPRLPAATYEGVRFPLPPVYVADALPPAYVCRAEVAAATERIAQLYGGVADVPAAAGVVDALDLVAAAIEQLYLMQLPPDSSLPVLRQALRDAAVGLPPRCGAWGQLDLQEGRTSAVVAGSLVGVEVGPRGALRLP